MIEDLNNILNTFFGVTLSLSFYQIFVAGKLTAGGRPTWRGIRFGFMIGLFFVLVLIFLGSYVLFGNELSFPYSSLIKFYLSLMPLSCISIFKGVFHDFFKNKTTKNFLIISAIYLIGYVTLCIGILIKIY